MNTPNALSCVITFFTLSVSRHDKNFFLSPTTIALLMQLNILLMVSSMMMGGTFSPPAVMINSLMRPVTWEINYQSMKHLTSN